MLGIFTSLTDIATFGFLTDKKGVLGRSGGGWGRGATPRKIRMRNYRNSIASSKTVKRTPSIIPSSRNKYIHDAKEAMKYAGRNYKL